MTPLFFFGSDRYAQVVIDHLRSKDLQTFSDLASLPHQLPPAAIGLSALLPLPLSPKIIAQFHGRLYNLHPSLLPQYRNVAPVPYAIAMGDQVTGITLQQIDEKIDHGEIVAQIKEPIQATDTTPTLLTRLFTQGAQLFLDHLANRNTGIPEYRNTDSLVFTRKLTGESGHLEWPLVLKLIAHQPINISDTANPLIKLRLTHHPDRTHNILPDLIRALTGYEKVWAIAPAKKGDLRISFVLGDIQSTIYDIRILLPGKPRPISWSDFAKYYL